MDAVDIAWLAGIIEGEGTVSVPASGAYPSVRVAMTDEDVVRRFQSVSGLGTIVTIKKTTMPHHKPQWQWNVCARKDVARLLCAIAPLLGERRRARVLVAAESLSRPPRPHGPPPKYPCGTRAAANRHYARGEKPCEPCRVALNTYQTARNKMKKVTCAF